MYMLYMMRKHPNKSAKLRIWFLVKFFFIIPDPLHQITYNFTANFKKLYKHRMSTYKCNYLAKYNTLNSYSLHIIIIITTMNQQMFVLDLYDSIPQYDIAAFIKIFQIRFYDAISALNNDPTMTAEISYKMSEFLPHLPCIDSMYMI